MELAAIEKGGYEHFMLKEIFEQPNTIHDCLRGRLDAVAGTITMAGVENNMEQLMNANRIMIVACGTSWHAGLIAEYVIEELCPAGYRVAGNPRKIVWLPRSKHFATRRPIRLI